MLLEVMLYMASLKVADDVAYSTAEALALDESF